MLVVCPLFIINLNDSETLKIELLFFCLFSFDSCGYMKRLVELLLQRFAFSRTSIVPIRLVKAWGFAKLLKVIVQCLKVLLLQPVSQHVIGDVYKAVVLRV
jgi:hypothetical protein